MISQWKCINKRQYNVVITWILEPDWLDFNSGSAVISRGIFASYSVFQFPLNIKWET